MSDKTLHHNTTAVNRVSLRAHVLLLLAAFLTLLSCGGREGRGDDGADTLEKNVKTVEYIKAISMKQPRRALDMLDSVERRKIMPAYDINALRAVVYNNSGNDNGKALHYALTAYSDSSLSSKPSRRLKVLTVLAYQYFKCGAYDRCLRSTELGISMARSLKDGGKEALMLNVKAMCESETGRLSQAIESFDRAIGLFKREVGHSGTWDDWSDLVDIYSQKANVLLNNHRYSAVGDMYNDFKAALDSMLKLKNEGIDGGNDRATAIFCAIYAVTFRRLGDRARAFDFYNRLTATAIAHTPAGVTYLVPYLMEERRYGEAIEKLREEEANFVKQDRDTVNYYYVRTLLPNMAKALYCEGYYRESAATGLRIVTLNDSLTQRIKRQNAIAISEMLDSKYKDLRLDKQARDLRTSRTVAVLVTVLLIAFVALTVRVFSYNRIIRRKNRAAISTIKELLAYKEQLAFLLNRQSGGATPSGAPSTAAADHAATISAATSAAAAPCTTASACSSAATSPTDQDEKSHRLFLQLEQRILNERLFLKPRLTRDELSALLGVSKNRFALLFMQYSDKSFTRYINDMRLDYAASQLCNNPNYSVEAIAVDCGFPVRQTFYRLFSEKFGLTPAEYRRVNKAIEG